MSEQYEAARVTMVKKRLANGEPCRKCGQTEDMLRKRGLWELVDEVVLADEADPGSPGMVLAQQHGVEIAPFFLVETSPGRSELFKSALQVAKKVLGPKKAAQEARLSGAGAVAAPDVEGPSAAPLEALSEAEVLSLAKELAGAPPDKVIATVLGRLGERAAIAFSGAEDVALIDYAAKTGLPFSVFCLDTGRLHPETLRFIDTVRQFYGIELHVVSPDFVAVEDLVRKKGLFSFYEEGHTECCQVRKIAPLKRVLGNYDGWLTGQRRDQSPTRTDVFEVEWDTSHHSSGMLKANPLAAQSSADVWKYLRDQDVPYNELHDRGFDSIGCEPCTRARRPGEHARAARWWWEDATKRECGLHLNEEGRLVRG